MKTIETITSFILVFCLLFGWFLTEWINKRTKILFKLHWSLYVVLSFVIFAVIASPLFAFKVNYIYIILFSCSPLCFMFGVSVSIILEHYKNKINSKKNNKKENKTKLKNNKKENKTRR